MDRWVVKAGDKYVESWDFDEETVSCSVNLTDWKDEAYEYGDRHSAYSAASCLVEDRHDDVRVLKRRG